MTETLVPDSFAVPIVRTLQTVPKLFNEMLNPDSYYMIAVAVAVILIAAYFLSKSAYKNRRWSR